MITPVSGARQGTHSPKKVEKFEGNLSDPCIQLPRKKPAVSEETAGSCSGFGMCVTGCGSLGEVVIQENGGNAHENHKQVFAHIAPDLGRDAKKSAKRIQTDKGQNVQ